MKSQQFSGTIYFLIDKKGSGLTRYASDDYQSLTWGTSTRSKRITDNRHIRVHSYELLHIEFPDSDFGKTLVLVTAAAAPLVYIIYRTRLC